MPAFRPTLLADDTPLTPGTVAAACAAVASPAHFFVARPFNLTVRHLPEEEVFWELFHGHALDRAQPASNSASNRGTSLSRRPKAEMPTNR